MGAGNQVEAIQVVELSRNFAAKQPTSAAGWQSPVLNVLGVRPHQVTERSFVRNFDASLKKSDLVECLNVGRQTSVDAENATFNYCTDS
jgi:hypothetical protein